MLGEGGGWRSAILATFCRVAAAAATQHERVCEGGGGIRCNLGYVLNAPSYRDYMAELAIGLI